VNDAAVLASDRDAAVDPTIRVGLQLHSVREALSFDPEGTLEQVAEIGYKLLELSGQDAAVEPRTWHDFTAPELRALGERLGVQFTGGQVTGLGTDNVDAVVDFYRDLGADHLTIPLDYFPTRQVVREKCALYNHLGEAAARHGLRLFYLNHYHEFQLVEGELVLDALLAGTDPELVGLELSPYWLMRGLVDPIKAFRKYRDRIGLLEQADYPLDRVDKLDMWHFSRHQPIAKNINKDIPLKGGEIEKIHAVQDELFSEIGDGILKLQELIDEANASGRVSYVFLRQDFTRMPSELDSVRRSFDNYRRVRGVAWR
jgi:sugar phosphate isomerase/epimerase